jgi:hypothetical protein
MLIDAAIVSFFDNHYKEPSMQKFLKFFLICSFTFCSFAANAQENTEQMQAEKKPQATATFETFNNAETNYSVEYPSNWQKNDVPQLDLVLLAPSENDARAHASMNIVSEKVGPEINLDRFYNESANNLSSALKEVKVEKSGSSTLNGVQSKWIQYTHVMQGIKFRVLQYFIVANDAIYLMTFSASEEDFDKYRSEFEHIASTFKITK